MSEPHVIKVDATLKNGDTLTIPYTITTSGTGDAFTIFPGDAWGTTTTGGTWTSTGPWVPLEKEPPDMTDWPPADIIDWYALQLAKKHPA